MGDRANIHLKNENVFFYTHYLGSELAVILRDALKRGRGDESGRGFNDNRWGDPPYLARIIFCEMIKDCVLETTGYGISNQIQDNEHPIISVDIAEQTVAVYGDRRTHEPGAPDRNKMTFTEFVGMTDKQAREWHCGKSEDD